MRIIKMLIDLIFVLYWNGIFNQKIIHLKDKILINLRLMDE